MTEQEATSEKSRVTPITCAAVGEVLGLYVDGLTNIPVWFDPDYDPPGQVVCKWWDEKTARAVVVSITPEAADLANIRAGNVYGVNGIGPDYDVVDTDRLCALGAVALCRADSDSEEKPHSLAAVHVHTSTMHISVSTGSLNPAIEIATRLVEEFGHRL